MRAFFDRLDSGAYDWPALIVVSLLFAGLTIWMRITSRRNKETFFAAQHAAQEAFEKLGRSDVTTQLKVMEALNAWSDWQRRPLPDGGTDGWHRHHHADYPSPDEWHALSLLQALPLGAPEQRVN